MKPSQALRGTVTGFGTGTVTVDVDSQVLTAVLLDGSVLALGDTVVLLQDRRRLVALAAQEPDLYHAALFWVFYKFIGGASISFDPVDPYGTTWVDSGLGAAGYLFRLAQATPVPLPVGWQPTFTGTGTFEFRDRTEYVTHPDARSSTSPTTGTNTLPSPTFTALLQPNANAVGVALFVARVSRQSGGSGTASAFTATASDGSQWEKIKERNDADTLAWVAFEVTYDPVATPSPTATIAWSGSATTWQIARAESRLLTA